MTADSFDLEQAENVQVSAKGMMLAIDSLCAENRQLREDVARLRQQVAERAGGLILVDVLLLAQENEHLRGRAEKAEHSARQFCGAHIGQTFGECPQCWGERQGEKVYALMQENERLRAQVESLAARLSTTAAGEARANAEALSISQENAALRAELEERTRP